MEQNLIKQYNLPSYIKNMTFAEASKAISKKFEGREDKVSKETMKELLTRLSQAQESLKEEKNESNDFFLGGAMAGGAGAAGAGGASALAGPLGIAAGMLAPSLMNKGLDALGGLFGGGKRLDAKNKAIQNQDLLAHNQAMMKNGGYTNEYSGLSPFSSLMFNVPNLPTITGTSEDFHQPRINRSGTDNVLNLSLDDIENAADGYSEGTGPIGEIKKDKSFFNKALNKTGDFLKDNYSDILRMSPVAMNAYQLSKLKKPAPERLDRLGNTYQKQYMDEATLQNVINNNFNMDYITDASGGSASNYASNARAANLSKVRAMSDAYMKANNINRDENRTAQQFDLNVDTVNLQQSNRENVMDAQNMGAYNTAKSSLLGQIGTDFGNIGRERKYMDMVKQSGLCYDSKGNYICDDEKDTNESKYGGKMDSNSLFSTYLDTLLNKKK